MRTTLSKWGNSLAVRIPSKILEGLDLNEESDLSISVQGEKIILSPVKIIVKDKLKLIPIKKLMKGMKKQKLVWGDDVGKEIW